MNSFCDCVVVFRDIQVGTGVSRCSADCALIGFGQQFRFYWSVVDPEAWRLRLAEALCCGNGYLGYRTFYAWFDSCIIIGRSGPRADYWRFETMASVSKSAGWSTSGGILTFTNAGRRSRAICISARWLFRWGICWLICIWGHSQRRNVCHQLLCSRSVSLKRRTQVHFIVRWSYSLLFH